MFPNIYRLKKIRKNEKFKKFEKSEKFRRKKLSRTKNFEKFCGINFRGKGQKTQNRLKLAAKVSDLKYTSRILRDVLIRRIANSDIQLKLLGHIYKNMPLEEVLQFVKAKEAGKRSASRLHDNNHHHHHHTNAIKS